MLMLFYVHTLKQVLTRDFRHAVSAVDPTIAGSSTTRAKAFSTARYFHMICFIPPWQAFLLGIVYVTFALWRLIDILNDDLGGNTVAAEFMLFIKTRQVPACLLYRWHLYGIDGMFGISGSTRHVVAPPSVVSVMIGWQE